MCTTVLRRNFRSSRWDKSCASVVRVETKHGLRCGKTSTAWWRRGERAGLITLRSADRHRPMLQYSVYTAVRFCCCFCPHGGVHRASAAARLYLRRRGWLVACNVLGLATFDERNELGGPSPSTCTRRVNVCPESSSCVGRARRRWGWRYAAQAKRSGAHAPSHSTGMFRSSDLRVMGPAR